MRELAEVLESRLLLSSYFVATGGNDTNAGTLAAPFATIARGMQAAQPGDTVYLRGGTYRETLSAIRSGTAGAPITVRSYNGEAVYISADDVVSGPWTQTAPGSGIYYAWVPTSLPQTFWSATGVTASGAGITEQGGNLIATVVNESDYSTIITRSQNPSTAWNFFAQPITWSVRGLSIASAGSTAIPLGSTWGWFSVAPSDWSGWSADDSFNVQYTGSGSLSLTAKKNTVNSWGTSAGTVTNSSITGFDLTLGPGTSGNVAYSLVAYPTSQVVASGQFAIAQSEWSDGGTGNSSYLTIFAQEGAIPNNPAQKFQMRLDSYQITSGANTILSDDFNDGDPTTVNYFPAGKSTSLSSGYDQVFANGVMQTEARTSNKVTSDLLNPDAFNLTMNSSYVLTSSALAGKPDNYYAGARFVGRVGLGWSWQTAVVASSTGNTVTMDPATISSWWWPNYSGNSSDSGIGYLYGKLSFLDADGEWYLQGSSSGPDTLYVRIAGGTNPTTQLIEHKVRNWTVNINGYDNIVLDGLNLRGGAVRLNGSGLVMQNCDAQYLSHFQTWPSASADGGNDRGGGVLVSGTGNTIRNSTIHDTAGSGVLATGSSHVFTRNQIYNIDYSGTYGTGMEIDSPDTTVTFNTIHDGGRDIIHPSAGGLTVMYNDLYHAGRLAFDLGCLYTWGSNGMDSSGHKSRLAYNWLHDPGNVSDQLSTGMYLDNFDRNYIIDHNVIWGFSGSNWNPQSFRINSPADGIEIYNNTIINGPSYNISSYDSLTVYNPDPSYWSNSNNGMNYVAQDNLVIPVGVSASTILENPASQDFRPRAGTSAVNPATTTGVWDWYSPDGTTNVPSNFALYVTGPMPYHYHEVTGQGVIIPGINDFYLGATPDSGAYDRGTAYWTPGVNGVVDTIPPAVSGVTVDSGAIQRSMVTTLSVTFSEPVVLSAAPFALLNRTGNAVPNVALNWINTSGDQMTWDITFTGSGLQYGSLPDGAYRLRVNALAVHDLAGNLMAGDYRQRFYRLFGDSNGDRMVDRTDLIAFRQALGGAYVGYFDYDSSGTLTLTDYSQLRKRMVQRLI